MTAAPVRIRICRPPRRRRRFPRVALAVGIGIGVTTLACILLAQVIDRLYIPVTTGEWLVSLIAVIALVSQLATPGPKRRVRRPRTALAPAHAHQPGLTRLWRALTGRLRPGPASPVADRP